MPQRTDIFELGRLGLTSGEGRRIELHVAVAGFDYGGQRYEVEPALVPVILDVSRTTNSGWAMRLRFEAALQGPCMRCLELADVHVAVDAREVEDLLHEHEAVDEVAVIGVDDEQFGQRLKAVVVTKDGASLSEDEVKKYVKSNLAGYKVPRDVEFIDELPRNATGKVLKRELREEKAEK